MPGPGRKSGRKGGMKRPAGAQLLGPEMGSQTMGMPRPEAPGLEIAPRAFYRNQYGTDIGVGVDPQSRGITGSAVIPVGDTTDGNRLEMRGGYSPEGGPSAYLGFKKINLPSVSAAEIEQSDPAVMEVLQRYPGATEELRREKQKRLREEALGINQTGGTRYEFGVDLFGGRNRGPSGPATGSRMAGDEADPRRALMEMYGK